MRVSPTIAWRIYILIGLFAAGFVTLAALSLSGQRQSLVNQRMEGLNALVDMATALAERSRQRFDEGAITEAQARARALTLIKNANYGTGNYFFVQDDRQIMLVHPDPKLIGADQSLQADGKGSLFNADVAPRAIRDGTAFIEYWWPRKGTTIAVKKLSVYRYYKPWKWIIGTGVYTDDIDVAVKEQALRFALIGAGILAVVLAIAYAIVRSILRPLKQLHGTLARIAAGDLEVEIAETHLRDELGDMARGIEVLKNGQRERRALESSRRATHEAERTRSGRLAAAAQLFETNVSGLTAGLLEASHSMEAAATTMTASVAEASRRSVDMASASERSRSGVQNVAEAASQLSATIGGVARDVAHSSEMASLAAHDARQTDHSVQSLLVATGQIGGIVALISKIAGHTNLLALNATIEAARAGEAGRGFAVVAGEVKGLANQTEAATRDIEAQIVNIQQETRGAADAVQSILARIEQIDALAAGVSRAVEDQRAASQDIVGSVLTVAKGAETVTQEMIVMRQESMGASAIAGQVLTAAREVARVSSDLGDHVVGFLREVKSA